MKEYICKRVRERNKEVTRKKKEETNAYQNRDNISRISSFDMKANNFFMCYDRNVPNLLNNWSAELRNFGYMFLVLLDVMFSSVVFFPPALSFTYGIWSIWSKQSNKNANRMLPCEFQIFRTKFAKVSLKWDVRRKITMAMAIAWYWRTSAFIIQTTLIGMIVCIRLGCWFLAHIFRRLKLFE